MEQELLTAPGQAASVTDRRRRAHAVRTRVLLVGGIVAGPLFVAVAAVQVQLRDAFDLAEHPLSLLSLGDLGWIQIANFILAGLLALGLAVAARRLMPEGRAATWGPRLLALFGIGLIAGGVFIADPAFGFPPGAPTGRPDSLSWHAMVHGVAPALGFLSLVAACFVFARRFAEAGQRALAAYSIATALVVLALSAWPGEDGSSVRLAAAMVPAWAWVTALSAWMLRELRQE